MELLVRYGTEEQKARWLIPLLEGKARSCFAMTEPQVPPTGAYRATPSPGPDGLRVGYLAILSGVYSHSGCLIRCHQH